jgi:dihydroceramidase
MHEKIGFWSPRTATLDWCEQNYEVTYYITEFWNTISNLVMILFPLYGIYWSFMKSRQAGHQEKLNLNNPYMKDLVQFRVPKSIYFCNIGLTLVGVGSWMFHMTLKYPMQLLDELPMIYGSGILIYTNHELILSVDKFNKQRSRIASGEISFLFKVINSRLFIFSLISAYCVSVTIVYLFIWTNPVFHEISYSLMVITIISQSFMLINKLSMSKKLYLLSMFYYAFGFFLWNLDNNFCTYLQTFRGYIDSAFGYDKDNYSNVVLIVFNLLAICFKSLLEFHSLWHLFTGYASYMTILFLIDCLYNKYIKENKSNTVRPVLQSKFFNLYYGLADFTIANETKIK